MVAASVSCSHTHTRVSFTRIRRLRNRLVERVIGYCQRPIVVVVLPHCRCHLMPELLRLILGQHQLEQRRLVPMPPVLIPPLVSFARRLWCSDRRCSCRNSNSMNFVDRTWDVGLVHAPLELHQRKCWYVHHLVASKHGSNCVHRSFQCWIPLKSSCCCCCCCFLVTFLISQSCGDL